MLLLCTFLAWGDFAVSFDSLGIYEGFQLYRAQNHFIALGRNEGILALVDFQGKVKRKYERTGQGPGELQFPIFLGLRGDGFLVISNNKHVLYFDDALNPSTNRFPYLPQSIATKIFIYGLKKGEDSYLLVGSGLSPLSYLVVELELMKNGDWRQKAAYFKQKNPDDPNMMVKSENYRINLHDRHFFRTTFVADDFYEVSVHKEPVIDGEDGETVQVLRQSVEDFPKSGPWYRASMLDSMKTEQGYAVTFRAKTAEQEPEPSPFVDFFKSDGSFIRRQSVAYSPVPCINCEEIWILQSLPDGEEVLKNLNWNEMSNPQ